MTSRARSALLIAALLAGSLATLAGCMKVEADLTVHEDETVSGTTVLAIDKTYAKNLGQSPDKLREELEKTLKKDAPTGVDCKAYEDDTYAGTKCTLDDVPFRDLSGTDDGDLKFEKSGDRFVVSGGADSSQLPSASTDVKPQVTFKISMPGKIVEHDAGAAVSGRTATYTDPTKMNKIRLVSQASGGFPLWAVIAVVAVLVAAAGAALVVVRRGTRRGGQPPVGQDQAPVPGQPAPGQWQGQPAEQYPSGQPHPGGSQYPGSGPQYPSGEQYPGGSQQYPGGAPQPAGPQQHPQPPQWGDPQPTTQPEWGQPGSGPQGPQGSGPQGPQGSGPQGPHGSGPWGSQGSGPRR